MHRIETMQGWGCVILRNYASGGPGQPARTSLGNVALKVTEALVAAAKQHAKL